MTEWLVHDFDDDTSMRYRVGHNELFVEFELIGDDGEMEISGSVKWDGCMNWLTNEECMYHFCSPSDADRMVVKFRKVWELGAMIMPK